VAQTAKPFRLVVPFTPGSNTDILAPALAPKLAAALGRGGQGRRPVAQVNLGHWSMDFGQFRRKPT